MDPDFATYALPPGLILFGLAFAAFGVHVIRIGRRLRRFGHRVPGVVVRLRWDSNDHGGGNYYPVLRFRTRDGTEVTTESDLGSNPSPVRAGQPVAVIYDPEKPKRARLDGPGGSGTVHGSLFLALGLLLAGIGTIASAVMVVAAVT
ncbi:DUF3592 domain-containing protein [Actinomadura sp. 9N407]|uniref:DUF3592 domain-containing protein n=1 Tax=Actinomadura sp. 9N407 TaxID=3375154 RepID=UPI0037A6BF97